MGATAKASPQGLEIVKQAALKKGWRKTSPALLDAASVSAATLKRFWRGIPIGLDSVRAICYAVGVDMNQIVEPSKTTAFNLATIPAGTAHRADDSTASELSNQGAIAESLASLNRLEDLSSRASLKESLKKQLLSSVRVLAIAGLTGIGKTTLAHQISSDLETQDYTLIHLTCDPIAPLTLASVVHAISKCACLDSFTFSLADLCDRLISQKYLFVIDNFEHLLCEDPVFGWGQIQSDIWKIVFQAILSSPNCHSRFILTTQDSPNAMSTLCDCPANRWQTLTLAGLTATEQTTLFQGKLAQKTPINTAQSAAITQIGNAYAGHPLALQAVAEDLATSYQDNALVFLHDRATDNLHNYSPSLQKSLQPSLIQTIARLQSQLPDAFKLLCAVSHNEKPMTALEQIQIGQTLELAPARCRELIDILCDRTFLLPSVRQNRLYFYPHPLIRSLMLTQIHSPLHLSKTPSK